MELKALTRLLGIYAAGYRNPFNGIESIYYRSYITATAYTAANPFNGIESLQVSKCYTRARFEFESIQWN